MSEERREIQLKPVEPLVTAEKAAENWKIFENLKERLLSVDDYQIIKGKRFIKRSGFRKIAVVFGISDRIIKEERIDRPEGSFSWRIIVEVQAPNGRTCIGVGACDSKERTFAHQEHDVYATAHTRAKSRAISDMVAGGIVSAEEVEAAAGQSQEPTDQPAKWDMKVSVTKSAIAQEGLKQYPIDKDTPEGLIALGMLNVLEDGSEASIVPEDPVAVNDPAITGFLVSRIFKGFTDQHKDFNYQLDQADGLLYAILIRGKIDEDMVKALISSARWAFSKALERKSDD